MHKPKSQNRSSLRKRSFDYQTLEPRQLLAVEIANVGPAVNNQLVDGFSDTELALLDTAREYLNNQPETAYLQSGSSDLRPIQVQYGLASLTTRFQQTHNGVPIHNAFITVNQGPDAEFQRVAHHLAYERILTPQLVTVDLDIDMAESIAMEAAGVTKQLAETRGEISWYVDETGQATKVWDITVAGLEPVGDFLTLVDVHTGDVLYQDNRAAFATGTGDVFDPNPWQQQGNGTDLQDNDDATNPTLDSLVISVTLEGLDEGTGLLIGEFVDLATLNSDSIPDNDADEPTRVYEYTRDDDRFEQVVVYYSVDQMNRYFHALGFDDDTGTPNGIRDFPTLANAHFFDADNSFYSPANDAIHFGDGGVDDAEDADIVAHEYGHAIQFNQNSNWGGGEMGAMGEGFGDFLAASFYADFGDATFQASHAAAVGEWDATSYSSADPPNLRRVDGNKMYPDDLGQGVHGDGEIWSRSLWDMRTNLGGDWANTLVLEHHFTLEAAALMPTAAEAILQANQNVYSGVFAAAVRNPFVERGILPAETLVSFSSLNYEANNTDDPITIAVSDANASGSVTVTVETAEGDVESVVLNETANGLFLGTINANGAIFSPNNGVIEVSESTTPITVTYQGQTDNSEITSDVVTALTVGEAGRIESLTDIWQTVTLIKEYQDPVVVAGPASRNGAAPVNVRIRNVTGTSFEIHIDEWEYDDGRHRNGETVDYVVVEEGEYELADGTQIVARNRHNQTDRWTTNSLSDTFVGMSEPPVILTQTISENDPISVTTRIRSLTNTEFQLRLQEEQGQFRGAHGAETVSWIAIQQGVGTIGAQTFEVDRTPTFVTQANYTINFASEFANVPAFFADMQTFKGGDTATVRYRFLDETQAVVYVEEERSLDREVRHNAESIGFWAVEFGEIRGQSSELRPFISGSNGESNPQDFSNFFNDQHVELSDGRKGDPVSTREPVAAEELGELAGAILSESEVLFNGFEVAQDLNDLLVQENAETNEFDFE